MSQLHHRYLLIVLAVLLSDANMGCITDGTSWNELEPVRISSLIKDGDAARRASLLLVDEGLESDSLGQSAAALARYERALQVDATNPYVYLAIARHHLEGREPALALQFLDHAASRLRMRGDLSDEVQVHLLGLRGAALYDSGQVSRAAELLDRARALSPRIWGDGRLDADELR